MQHPQTGAQLVSIIDSRLGQYQDKVITGKDLVTINRKNLIKKFKGSVTRLKLESQEFWGFMENKVFDGATLLSNMPISSVLRNGKLSNFTPAGFRVYYLTVFFVKDGFITFRYFMFDPVIGEYSSTPIPAKTVELNRVKFSFLFDTGKSLAFIQFLDSSRLAEEYVENRDRLTYYKSKFDELSKGAGLAAPKIIGSQSISQALEDLKSLYQINKVSAVDRAHTVLHGYLAQVAQKNNLEFQKPTELPTISQYYKLIRTDLLLKVTGQPSQAVIESIVHGTSNVLDKINTVRNTATLAHPNQDLITEDEAELVIQSTILIIKYLQKKYPA